MCPLPSFHVSPCVPQHVTHRSQAAAHIQRSWDRCASLDPVTLTDLNPMADADLAIQRDLHRDLLHHAGPEIASLEALVSGAHSVVILADSNGLILQQRGCKKFLDKARQVALRPGVNWAESRRGTNAIGTALYEKRAIRVHGPEHYLSCNHILNCDAALVWSGQGDVLGVLDLTGPARQRQDYAWGLVQVHATNISNRLLEASSMRRLIFHTNVSRLDTIHRAIVLIDDMQCVAAANPAALALLGTDWTIIGSPLAQWMDGYAKVGGQPGALHRHDGASLVGVVAPVKTRVLRSLVLDTVDAPKAVAGCEEVIPDAQYPVLCAQGVRAVSANLSVLLYGETGTGKEVLARDIYQHSAWKTGEFVAINCGALPESLIESELFGYEGGAFTGARREGARGLLAQANGGVLFLDEIADMPMSLQTRLLRVLQEREVQPLGSEKRLPLRFGVISASNQNLSWAVQQGQFRSDLYYRLQGIQLSLPPLRDRPDLKQFLTRKVQGMGLNISADALKLLCEYDWLGNYREMQSVLRRLPCQYPDATLIEAWMLSPELRKVLPGSHDNGAQPPYSMTSCSGAPLDSIDTVSVSGGLRRLERQTILRALHDSRGNVSQAARVLGIHRSELAPE